MSNKMNAFIFSDGLEKQFDDKENEVLEFEMEVDNEVYPVENMIDFDTCLKPPEKESKESKKKLSEKGLLTEIREKKNTIQALQRCRKGKGFSCLSKKKKGMSVRAAALKLNINERTAQG